jgi:hypothetical protein
MAVNAPAGNEVKMPDSTVFCGARPCAVFSHAGDPGVHEQFSYSKASVWGACRLCAGNARMQANAPAADGNNQQQTDAKSAGSRG